MSEKQNMNKARVDRLSRKLMILLALLVVVCIGLLVWAWSLTEERQKLKGEIAHLKAAQEGLAGQLPPDAEPTEEPDSTKEPEVVLEETPAKYFDIMEAGSDACTITGYSGKELDVVIPAVIEGRQVTKIGRSAFFGRKITSVVLPEGVMEIEEYAFEGCDRLISITLPETLTLIGAHAFEDCSKLAGVSIPAGVAEIGDSAFNACYKLKSVEFSEGLLRIGEEAFNACHMESLVLPDSLTEIGRGAFVNCSWITSVDLPRTLTAVGEEVFAECLRLTSVDLPDTVVSIGSSAFSGCALLKEVRIPDSVQDIGRDAFAECDALTVFVSRDSYAAKWAMDNDIDREYVEAGSNSETPADQPEGNPAGEAETL